MNWYKGSLDTEVTDLAYDSRKITEGMLFVAIAGTVVDGHKFIPDVLKKGASVIVKERDVKVEDESGDGCEGEKCQSGVKLSVSGLF